MILSRVSPAGPHGHCEMIVGFFAFDGSREHDVVCALPAIGRSVDDVPVCLAHFEHLVAEGLAAGTMRSTCSSCGATLSESDPGAACRACRD